MPDPSVEPPIISERMNDLARRAIAGDERLCDFVWEIEGEPHGCCLLPDHDGEHWCSCEAVAPLK